MSANYLHTSGSKKTAIITGSSKGIGHAIAVALAAAGVQVMVTSRDQAVAEDVAATLRAQGGSAIGVAFDIEQRQHMQPLIDATLKNFGSLDILVNNALGFSIFAPLMETPDDAICAAMTHNLTHTLLLSRLAYPYLKARQGQIINIASAAANRALLGIPLYAILKGALNQATRVLAAEWAQDQIRVNGINPSFIRTEAFAALGMPEEMINKSYEFYRRYQPMGKIGQPQDVAQLVAFLCSNQANFISGANLDIDGAFSCQGLAMYAG